MVTKTNQLNMKKLAFLLLITSPIFTIQAKPKLSGGIESGWNISYPSEATQVCYGFNAGVFGQMELSRKWYVGASIKLSSKPFKEKHRTIIHTYLPPVNAIREEHGTPYVIDLPIHAGYKIHINKDMKLTIALGPYLALGIFGKAKIVENYINEKGETMYDIKRYSIYSGDNDYSIKRYQVGADAKIGFEINSHYIVSTEYQFQFNNPSKGFSSTSRAQIISLNFGYKF